MMFRLISLFLLLGAGADAAMTDSATKISFSPKRGELHLFGVGVRKKGPIKIYSVGVYCQNSLKEKLAAISGKNEKEKAIKTLRDGAKAEESAFVLTMAMKVGAEKIANGIATSLLPRHKGSSGEVDALKGLILDGVASAGGAAEKGCKIEFTCSPESGVEVAVNGKSQGDVASPELAKAFCDIYLDDKCVSPAMVASCLDSCCAP